MSLPHTKKGTGILRFASRMTRKRVLTGTKSRIFLLLNTGCRGHPCPRKRETQGWVSHLIKCFILVRGAGLEPARYCYHQPLKLACLPFHHPRIMLLPAGAQVEGVSAPARMQTSSPITSSTASRLRLE